MELGDVRMKKKLIILVIALVLVIVILIVEIPKYINYSMFKKTFDDTGILLDGYTTYGLTYLNIYPNEFNMKYSERDIGYVKGADITIKGKVRMKSDNTIHLTYEGGTISCSILNSEVLDCNDAVFRRYNTEYKKRCEAETYEFADAVDAGINDAFHNRQGANYNNPYEKTDPCYQEYDFNYETGLFNGYERRWRTDKAFENAKKGNACLSLGGRCVK